MESLEELQARHRRELRDLQGRITNKKKNATKKTRKGVNDECATMERVLREKQAAELQAATGGGAADEDADAGADATEEASPVDSVAAQLAETQLTTAPGNAPPPPPPQPQPQPAVKRNRQKERLARRAAEQQAAAARAADEAANMVDHAAVERAVLAPLLAQSGRVEHPIRPDGHCLFSAVADQLARVGRRVEDVRGGAGVAGAVELAAAPGDEAAPLPPYRVVRHVAAAYMAAHRDDFAPFFFADDDAGGGGGGDLDAHIAQIRDTAEWGGQLELSALASAYDVAIRVLHDGRSELIEPAGGGSGSGGEPRPTLWLVYYRHGFGLGEHYNSLREKAAA